MIVYHMISEVIQNNLICIIRCHGIDIPILFQWGVNKVKTVNYCWLCDDFGCYFGIIQLFLVNSINVVHSCIAMLQAQTMYSKLSGKY